MTSNQISYGQLLETVRHNKATEDESVRHNKRSEAITSMYNTGNLELGYQNLAETTRHNKANEQYNVSALNESIRHNYANEQIGASQVALGYAQLNEQTRHNQQQERLSKYQTDAAIYKTDSDALNTRLNIESQMKMKDWELSQSKYNTEYTADLNYQAATQGQGAQLIGRLLNIFT